MKTFIILLTSTAILTGCAPNVVNQGGGVAVAATTTNFASTQKLRPQSDVIFPSGYESWKSGFRSKALSNGISPSVFDAAFAGTGVNKRVLELDRNQAEFKRTIWEYLDTATRPSRVSQGRAQLAQNGVLLNQIEAQYGVEKEVVLAIWGLESSFGRNLGDIPIVEGLATLAYDGRRRGFAEEQLLTALRIQQRGDVRADAMIGSWAGAMGHTQFIPTSYDAFGVDQDGDGRRNLWTVADALGSTANYLKRNGWVAGQPWGVEVTVPAGFDYGAASESNRQAVSSWNARGVRLATGGPIPNYGSAAIIAPAGAAGPKFAVFKNFRVIKTYNNATSYALAVGHLGDKIAGSGDFRQSWPFGANQLRASQVEELQRLLQAKGYDIEKIDGVLGENTSRAISNYQKDNGLVADGVASPELLARLR